ncbi:MAG: hypothetical protein GTN49_07765 [candidate division Zixibacteria bacterium]|nr:hypothetical protein [candidate division Zixibacteria bacterium]
MSYVAFLGLFVHLYGRGDVARHGRRGFVIFIWEVVALILIDVIRISLGWPAAVFVPVLGVVALGNCLLIVRAVKSGGPKSDLMWS